nr:phosphopantetheine-binding protein [Mycolicibacterium fortuitum]
MPAPEYTDTDHYRAPSTATEEILAGIYAQVLGLERVGVDDSFFDLGGDSILAMRVVAAVNTDLDAGLAVRTLFDAPTVAQLSPHVGEDSDRRAPLAAGERPALIPLSFAQNRMWFLNRFEDGAATYNMPIAFRINGALDLGALESALDDCAPCSPTSTGCPHKRFCPHNRGCGAAEARRWCRCRKTIWSTS